MTALPTDVAPPRKAYPQAVSGRFRRLKTLLSALALALFHLGPWLRWDRGPGLPGQAVLLDVGAGRGWLFGAVLWPDEVYYLVGLLVAWAVALFGASALWGRVWCGFACPQTIWTELFVRVEAALEGDRNARLRLDRAPWSAAKLARKSAKHLAWLGLSALAGFAWTSWFVDAPAALWSFATLDAGPWMWASLLTVAATVYLLAGIVRETFCVHMCPWPRIQAAMGDEGTRSFTYLAARGEPRGKARAGGPAGDCVDCQLCVRVCPTGTDIRQGPSASCINCGLCADACDPVMRKLGRQPGLIAFAAAAEAEAWGRPLPATLPATLSIAPARAPARRPRAKAAATLLALAAVAGAMGTALATRPGLTLAVEQERAPGAVRLSDGSVQNGYRVHLSNRTLAPATATLTLDTPGAPVLRDALTGAEGRTLTLRVGPNEVLALRVFAVTRGGGPRGNHPARFVLGDGDGGPAGEAATVFSTP